MIHFIHGIHTDGPAPMRGLVPILEAHGFVVRYPEYGWIAGLETRRLNPLIVGTLAPYVASTDILIGHSNGCAIAYELLCSGLGRAAVFINAALMREIIRPPSCEKILVLYNEGDTVTEIAEVLAHVGLTDEEWGDMGHAGYLGSDPNIPNVDCGHTSGLPIVSGHSDFFTPGKLEPWGNWVGEWITEEGRQNHA